MTTANSYSTSQLAQSGDAIQVPLQSNNATSQKTSPLPTPRRIFIVGSPRSGTTLLQSLLAAHSAVLGFTESHFFDKGFQKSRLSRRWKVGSALADRVRSFFAENACTQWTTAEAILKSLTANTVADAETLIHFFDQCAMAAGKSVWMEKTPDHVRRIELLQTVAPDAMFVHIIRRPVETILSLRKAKLQWGGNNSWLGCFGHWYSAMWYSQAYASQSRHQLVTYEELTADPDQVMMKLLSRLDLPWEDGLDEKRIEATHSLVRADETWKSNNYSRIESRPPVSDQSLPPWLRLVVRRVPIYDSLRQQSLSAKAGMAGS